MTTEGPMTVEAMHRRWTAALAQAQDFRNAWEMAESEVDRLKADLDAANKRADEAEAELRKITDALGDCTIITKRPV